MKKILTYFLIVICGQITIAQVGIGTNSPTAMFHVKSDQDYIFTLNDGKTSEDSYVLTAGTVNGYIEKQSTNIFKNIKFATLNTYGDENRTVIPTTEPYEQKYVGNWYGIRAAQITLPYGKWAVYITSLITLNNMANVNAFKNTALTADIMIVDATNTAYDSPSVQVEGDTKDSVNGNGFVSGTIVFPNQKDIIKGIIIINNNDSGRRNVTYRFAARVTVNTEDEYAFDILRGKTVAGILNATNSQTQVYAVPLN